MPKYRKNRINDAVMQEISGALRDVKDPRVSSHLITVTGAEVSGDLKYAKIFYSVLGDYDEKELKAGLRSAAVFLRGRLAQNLNLRVTPELTFVFDPSVSRGAEISSILRELHVTPETAPEGEDDGEAEPHA